MATAFLNRRYTPQGLFSLFLMCALPLHIWTMILAFRDMSWVADRTNAWDAVGVFSYGLLFALLESLIVFLLTALLGFVVSTRWDRQRRLAFLTVLVFMLSLWAIAEQLFFLLDVHLPGFFIDLLIRSGHPLRTLYMVVIPLVGITILVPVLLVLRSPRVAAFVHSLIDRLSLLAMFYLVFDALGLVIILIRNL